MADASATAWANPSSTHRAGQASRQLLENARELVAQSIGAAPADMVLTGGGTEACNLGIRGLARGCRKIITTAVEHPAVTESVHRLARDGREVSVLPVPAGTPPDPSELARHLSEDTLVAVQWVNHETGTLFPVYEYARTCRARGARLFIDATQALGKIPVDVSSLGPMPSHSPRRKSAGLPGPELAGYAVGSSWTPCSTEAHRSEAGGRAPRTR